MIIVCPTVPHTGTHFMRELLLEADVERVILVHPYRDQVDELQQLILEGAIVIIPVRGLDNVMESWKKYGKDLHNYAGRSLLEWFQAQDQLVYLAMQKSKVFHLNLEQPAARDDQLALINKTLGLDLVTDWQPVRQDGPIDQREQIAQQFAGL